MMVRLPWAVRRLISSPYSKYHEPKVNNDPNSASIVNQRQLRKVDRAKTPRSMTMIYAINWKLGPISADRAVASPTAPMPTPPTMKGARKAPDIPITASVIDSCLIARAADVMDTRANRPTPGYNVINPNIAYAAKNDRYSKAIPPPASACE